MNGSFMTWRSNQKWTPVIGSVFDVCAGLRMRGIELLGGSLGSSSAHGVVRNGEDVGVGCLLASVIEFDRGDGTIFDYVVREPESAANHFPALLLDGQRGTRRRDRRAERPGDAHAVAGAIGQDRFPEDVDAITGVGVDRVLRQVR